MKGNFLNRYQLFIGLKEDELEKLVRRMKERKFKEKEVILGEGEKCPDNPSIYIIDKGRVSLAKKDSRSAPQKIGAMMEGNIFGIENLAGKLRGVKTLPLTYEASSEVILHTLSNEDLKQALSEAGYIAVALNMARYLSRWMRACLERCATIEASKEEK